jgi:hypothetical protein
LLRREAAREANLSKNLSNGNAWPSRSRSLVGARPTLTAHACTHPPRCEFDTGPGLNRDEATDIVRQELTKYRSRPYIELRELVDTSLPTVVVTGPSGTKYQVAVHVHWESRRGGDIRIVGLIDDFGWRTFFPLHEDFITGPNDVISAGW